MKTLIKATILALVVELVFGGLLVLGRGDYLDRLHLGVLGFLAMVLHVPSFLIIGGGWADRLAFQNHDLYTGILVSVQWLVWAVIIYALLLFRNRRSRKVLPSSQNSSGVKTACGKGMATESDGKNSP